MIVALLAVALAQDALPPFKEQVVDPDVGVGYALTVADVNADGKPDLVVVTEQPDQVVWYENPGWKRRLVIGGEVKLPVCIQALDVDGDGKTELLLGADWKPSDTSGGGSVWLLRRPDDLEKPWTPIALDAEPTMHRFRAIDLEGDGRRELVCKTLHGRGAKPGQGAPASLFVLKRPSDPFAGKWTRMPIPHELHITHNFWAVDWDGDRKEEILLAGLEGIVLLKRTSDGWTTTRIGDGDPVKKGGGEVKVGRLPGGRRYVATVEPWHGHSAVVYVEPDWRRRVLVENHKGGHAVWTADLTGKGVDSLVVGFRGVPEGKKDECVVYVFHPLDAAGEKWEKKVLDDKGLGSEDVICADFDGDGRIDVAGVGRSTKNVKIYWNGK